ncbi:MAG: metallophosphoesterase [Acidaminococcaceae bacterium]|nr:metallophosphoesterase [Acidaminococcaceae bacterium]
MRFSIFIATVDLLLTVTTIFYYRYIFKSFRGGLYTFLYLLFSFNIVLNSMLSDAYPLGFLRMEAYLSGLWLGILFYSFIIAVLHILLYGICWGLGLNLRHKAVALVMMFVFGGIYIYGCRNAFQPVIRHEGIVTTKLEQGTRLRIAMVSDVHLGRLLGRNFSRDVVGLIKSQNPDMVIIAGDLADGKLNQIIRGNALEPFDWLDAPQGVYMVFGNHDYFDNPVKWQRMLKLHKIKVLQSRSVPVLNGMVKLSGLIDFSRDSGTEGLRQLATGNEHVYSILVDHQPKRLAAAEEEKYDLYLSGHTHTGQMFPNRLVTHFMYDIDYGRRQYGNMTVIVSSGIGFWGPPVRSFTAPEVVVIDIEGSGSKKDQPENKF